MLMWILEIIFIIVLMKCIEEIGFGNSCWIGGIVYAVTTLFTTFNIFAILSAFLSGLVMGALAYLSAKVFLFLIEVLGALGKFLVVLILVAALIAIIF